MTRSQLVFGLLFIAVGILLLADQAGQASAWAVIAGWWPTVVIASGVAQLTTRPRNAVGGVLLVLIGGALLAWTLGGLVTVRLAWPLLLIGLGVWLLVGRTTRRGGGFEGRIEVSAIVDDRMVALPAGRFAGGSAVTVFGDLHLDLLDATLDEDGATLDTTTVFGDLRLDIPNGWQLRVSGPELFGDVTSDRVTVPPGDGPVLRLRVLTVFGDVAVRSRPGRPAQDPAMTGRQHTS